MRKMKVVGINGSPRKDGNTAIIINTVFGELNARGIETELIQLAEHKIEGCTGCWGCRAAPDGRCVMDGDCFNQVFSQMVAADGIILGSPVYASGVTSQIKALIDRASAVLSGSRGLFRHKVGAAVVTVRRGGAVSTFDTLTRFLHSKEMFLVGSTYWNLVYGRNIGEVESDAEGLANMRNLAENMAWLLHKINAGRP